MAGRLGIAAGLLGGVIFGVALLALVAVLLPPPDAPVVPTPTIPVAASPVASPEPDGSPGVSATPDTGGVGFHLGQPAPPLRVTQLGGGEIDLENLRGKPVWVNFMATYCPPCRDEFPLMNSFMVRYADTGLVVVAVDVREDIATVNAFAQELTVQFPIGLDEQGTAQRTWGAYALPMHFWIDAEGIVRDGALGGVGPDVMAAALERILPGVNVEP